MGVEGLGEAGEQRLRHGASGWQGGTWKEGCANMQSG